MNWKSIPKAKSGLMSAKAWNNLNMIELRKNYDESLNKSKEADILGYKFKKY